MDCDNLLFICMFDLLKNAGLGNYFTIGGAGIFFHFFQGTTNRTGAFEGRFQSVVFGSEIIGRQPWESRCL